MRLSRQSYIIYVNIYNTHMYTYKHIFIVRYVSGTYDDARAQPRLSTYGLPAVRCGARLPPSSSHTFARACARSARASQPPHTITRRRAPSSAARVCVRCAADAAASAHTNIRVRQPNQLFQQRGRRSRDLCVCLAVCAGCFGLRVTAEECSHRTYTYRWRTHTTHTTHATRAR